MLIVSKSEQLNSFVKRVISGMNFTSVEIRHSAAQAAQELANRSFDLILVNAPLADEFGGDFIMDVCTRYNSGLLVIVPGEVSEDIAEQVIDYGAVVLAKPVSNRALARNVRHLVAIRNRMWETEKKVVSLEEKIRELRIINRAKCLLIEQKHMTEEEAHRHMTKTSMDRCISMKKLAEEIIEDLE